MNVLIYITIAIYSTALTIMPGGDYICELNFKGPDKDGHHKVELKESMLFTYSDSNLRDYLIDRDLLTSFVSMAVVKGEQYLVLRVSFASSRVAKLYDGLETSSPIRLEFMDNQKAFLKVVNTREVVRDGFNNIVILATINKSDAKLIRKCRLDRLGIYWQSGFETYEIYDIDLLQNQYECLVTHS